jgi:hypothetical protein
MMHIENSKEEEFLDLGCMNPNQDLLDLSIGLEMKRDLFIEPMKYLVQDNIAFHALSVMFQNMHQSEEALMRLIERFKRIYIIIFLIF